MKTDFKIKFISFLLIFSSLSLSALARQTFLEWLEWHSGRAVHGFNIHRVDPGKGTEGFALYRMSAPIQKDLKSITDRKIKKIIVLSHNADDHERKIEGFPEEIEIIEVNQFTTRRLDKDFLGRFDRIISEAKKGGYAVAIRCQIGCHRTGRLAAYFEMRWLKHSAEEALVNYDKHGYLNRIFHRQVRREIRDLYLNIQEKD